MIVSSALEENWNQDRKVELVAVAPGDRGSATRLTKQSPYHAAGFRMLEYLRSFGLFGLWQLWQSSGPGGRVHFNDCCEGLPVPGVTKPDPLAMLLAHETHGFGDIAVVAHRHPAVVSIEPAVRSADARRD